MKMGEIQQLEELLQPYIGPDSKFVNYTSKKLTAPGENYGSVMLALEVTLRNSKNKETFLHVIAKLIPDSPWLRESFQVQITVVQEMNFYAEVVPRLIQFQLEQGMENTMDFFPKYFGGRINLSPGSDIVDENSVILLENLKVSGYNTVDRVEGFNKEVTEFILKDLAVFHAVPIAFKLKKPDMFKKEIWPHIKNVNIYERDGEMEEIIVNSILDCAAENPETALLSDRIKRTLYNFFDNEETPHEGLFVTINHNDFWVNNTMLKFDEHGKPVSNKMVDFQLINYASLGKDVVFLLFCSVQSNIVEQYYDHFVKVYYDKFIEVLTKLQCDITPFTLEALEKQLKMSAKETEFFHCLMFTKPLLMSPHVIKDMADFLNIPISQKEKGKMYFIIKEFAKRDWI